VPPKVLTSKMKIKSGLNIAAAIKIRGCQSYENAD
jgi:hypothetical protein